MAPAPGKCEIQTNVKQKAKKREQFYYLGQVTPLK